MLVIRDQVPVIATAPYQDRRSADATMLPKPVRLRIEATARNKWIERHMGCLERITAAPKSQWYHFILVFAFNVLATGILLPVARVQPSWLHKHCSELSGWIRVGTAFSFCVLLAAAMFKLLSPRVRHLAHFAKHPPAWLAVLLAWLVVAVLDVRDELHPSGYRATAWEWFGYGGCSLLVVALYSALRQQSDRRLCSSESARDIKGSPVTHQDIESAPWDEIEAWLTSGAPAQYDFIGNQSIAHRVSLAMSRETRSVGIVGPFGAGKTSIVSWVADRLKRRRVGSLQYFVCHQSCWGFETSSSAIRDMLSAAISELNNEISTFQFDSLPEAYRRAFSDGSTWFETVSNLLTPSPDPMEQFSRLSDILGEIGCRLVFIVEDLDRNDTRGFEVQEVLAFLERLKAFPNLRFILTGGLSSQRIDFAKLCDHIEYLRTIQPDQSSALIERVRQRCLDHNVFSFVALGDPNRNYGWNPLAEVLLRDFQEYSLAQAAALLLNTPRALRHALGRTLSAWNSLHGEIDFDQLLIINVLRFGATECFEFLMRRHDRLRSVPDRNPPYGQEHITAIRQAIVDDWNQTVRGAEWNPKAALKLMEVLLPSTEYWLEDSSQHPSPQHGRQTVSDVRYWRRAISESVDMDDVRDQAVIKDIQDWLATPSAVSKLVTKLTSQARYAQVWEDLAAHFLANRREQILLLCEQVIRRIISENGSSACGDSQGFANTWRFALNHVSTHSENKTWLQDQISEAAHVSIELVNSLWHYYGPSINRTILGSDDRTPVRQHLLDAIRVNVISGPSLLARLSPNASATLYQLVFDPGDDMNRVLVDVGSWSWLGPYIVDAIRNGSTIAAANCNILLGARVDGRDRSTVNTEVLDQFFGNNASEVLDILDSMNGQLPENDRSLARTVVATGRQHLANADLPSQQTEYEDNPPNDPSGALPA